MSSLNGLLYVYRLTVFWCVLLYLVKPEENKFNMKMELDT